MHLAPSSFRGHYFDGKSAARLEVDIEPRREGLHFRVSAGAEHLWSWPEVRQVQGFVEGEPVRLEKGGELPEALVVGDPGFAHALRHAAGAHTHRFKLPSSNQSLLQKGAFAAVGLVLAAAGLYLWGIPWISATAAQKVPVEWESALGAKVVENLSEDLADCEDPELKSTVTTVLERLSTTTGSPYTFNVRVLDDGTVNALAAPGGHLVLFRGLLEKMETPEELAGILAHEVRHVTLRHTSQAMLRELSMAIGISALTGGMDISQIAGAARMLGSLQMSREAESQADLEGLELMLQAGFRGEAMIAAFGALGGGEELSWLSTHPDTRARREALTLALAGRTPAATPPALPGAEAWKAMVARCRVE